MAQARLNGTIVDDGGLPCEGRFEYGTTPTLGTFTPWIAGAFRTGDSFYQLITGLAGNTVYYFYAEARNAMGTATAGSTLSFVTTKAEKAAVEILAPTLITAHSARFHAIVSYHGDRPGNVRFHYGANISYGMRTPFQYGFATGDEFQADIDRLSEGTAYHCRAELQSSPPVYSKDLSFSTLAELGGITLIDDEILHLLEAG